MMIKCCVCDKALVDSEWRELNRDEQEDVLFSHGFCPVCFDRAMEAFKRSPRVLEEALN